MPDLIKKSFDSPDDSMHPVDKLSMDEIELNGKKLRRVTAQSGWKWSIDLKPVVKTDSCQEDHLLYMISGRMVVHMDDGKELEYGPGDVAAIPPGHDGWGVGEEPTVWLDIPH